MSPKENNILDWIETTNFEQLTPGQKKVVLMHSSESEYSHERNLIVKSQEMFVAESKELIVDSSVKASLDSTFEKNTNKAMVLPLIQRILIHRIPLYQTVAASLLIFLSTFFYLTKSTTTSSITTSNPVVYQTVYDTIIERITDTIQIPVETTIVKVVYKEKPGLVTNVVNLNQTENNASLDVYTEFTQPIEKDAIDKSLGNSRIRENDLEQFRVSM